MKKKSKSQQCQQGLMDYGAGRMQLSDSEMKQNKGRVDF